MRTELFLAEKLGMTRRELLERIDSHEITLWQAEYQLRHWEWEQDQASRGR